MAKILSISYDPILLETRDLILRKAGYDVSSVVGFSQAIESTEHYDLIVMGHSIPQGDKRAIVRQLRERGCDSPVLSLIKPGERQIVEAAAAVEPVPELVLSAIRSLLSS
jgi:DNA-binding response OmpR family regulator